MHQRSRQRRSEPAEPRPDAPRRQRSTDAVLALQQAIGNRETAGLLAREKKDKNRPSYEHSVKIGKLGPIEITGGNVADWAAKKDPAGLEVVSPAGKHSAELKRMFDTKARIDTVETASVVGENTLVTITFQKCRITRYSAGEKHDEWTVEFEGAKRHTVSIGAPRR